MVLSIQDYITAEAVENQVLVTVGDNTTDVTNRISLTREGASALVKELAAAIMTAAGFEAEAEDIDIFVSFKQPEPEAGGFEEDEPTQTDASPAECACYWCTLSRVNTPHS